MSAYFEQTERNRIGRLPKRGHYDKATIYSILDAGMIAHVGFVQDGQPYIIPTLYARDEDTVLLHGANTSRMLQHAAAGGELCLSVTLVDGIVLARSIFHHSINYRSAVVFGRGTAITEPDRKLAIMRAFVDKLLPGRWDDSRLPADNEFKATMMVAVPIDSASAKVRSGMPGDDEEDINLPFWAGVLPLHQHYDAPLPADNLPAGIPLPRYIQTLIEEQNNQGAK